MGSSMNPYQPNRIQIQEFGRKVRRARRRLREEIMLAVVLNAIWIVPIVVGLLGLLR